VSNFHRDWNYLYTLNCLFRSLYLARQNLNCRFRNLYPDQILLTYLVTGDKNQDKSNYHLGLIARLPSKLKHYITSKLLLQIIYLYKAVFLSLSSVTLLSITILSITLLSKTCLSITLLSITLLFATPLSITHLSIRHLSITPLIAPPKAQQKLKF